MSKTDKARLGDVDNQYRPTVIEFILDETGSMTRFKASTIAGYNTFISEQREQDGQCLLSLTKFSTDSVLTPFVDLDVKMVVPMTTTSFVPAGLTNLRDTIGQRVRALEARIADWTVKPNLLVIAMTDGDDNASREYSDAQIKDMIKAHEAEGWTFVFLAACPHGIEMADKMGFQPGNTKQFEGGAMEETMTTLSTATTAYRATCATSNATSASKQYFG